MEKVWRPFRIRERRPVTPLNGNTFDCFKKKSPVFVKQCKSGNLFPIPAAHFRQKKPNPYQYKLKII
jgi:hypothetical protein